MISLVMYYGILMREIKCYLLLSLSKYSNKFYIQKYLLQLINFATLYSYLSDFL